MVMKALFVMLRVVSKVDDDDARVLVYVKIELEHSLTTTYDKVDCWGA